MNNTFVLDSFFNSDGYRWEVSVFPEAYHIHAFDSKHIEWSVGFTINLQKGQEDYKTMKVFSYHCKWICEDDDDGSVEEIIKYNDKYIYRIIFQHNDIFKQVKKKVRLIMSYIISSVKLKDIIIERILDNNE